MRNGKSCFGVIIGTRAYFNSELARDVRKQLLKTITDEGYEYVILPEDATPTGSSSIETREDGLKVARQFREHRDEIDGIIVSLPNFGFEIGIINAINDAELNVPILVQACDDENDKVDLDSRRDAFCGKISVLSGTKRSLRRESRMWNTIFPLRTRFTMTGRRWRISDIPLWEF